jgi:hypothetical protein
MAPQPNSTNMGHVLAVFGRCPVGSALRAVCAVPVVPTTDEELLGAVATLATLSTGAVWIAAVTGHSFSSGVMATIGGGLQRVDVGDVSSRGWDDSLGPFRQLNRARFWIDELLSNGIAGIDESPLGRRPTLRGT